MKRAKTHSTIQREHLIYSDEEQKKIYCPHPAKSKRRKKQSNNLPSQKKRKV